MSPKRRWRSSERVALELLESLGYRVVEVHKKVRVEGVEVGEVDAIVEDGDGTRYAVEVKAGSIDVTGVRQAYVNASILGLKPMVVAKGFSDESAEALARRLGVEAIMLSDYFLVEAEELELLIREVFESVLANTVNTIMSSPQLTPEDKRVLEAVASSPTIADAAGKLSISISELAKRIRLLQKRGAIPRSAKSYNMIRYYASLLLARQKLYEIIELLRAALASARNP